MNTSDTDNKRHGSRGTEGTWEREDVPDKSASKGDRCPGPGKPLKRSLGWTLRSCRDLEGRSLRGRSGNGEFTLRRNRKPVNSALGLLLRLAGEKHLAPQPSLGPAAASAVWGLSLPLGHEAAPSEKGEGPEPRPQKPQGMFGKQNADAARGRKQTEAACFWRSPVWGAGKSREEGGVDWDGVGREERHPGCVSARKARGFSLPGSTLPFDCTPIFLRPECPQLEHEGDFGPLRAAEVGAEKGGNGDWPPRWQEALPAVS